MRSFSWESMGHRFEVVFKLIKGGRWHRWRDSTDPTKMNRALAVDYPPIEDLMGGDSEFLIGEDELEEMDAATRSMLFQTLKMNAPEYGCSYS
jgi:hypothetical protein